MKGVSTQEQALCNLWGGLISSMNLCRHFSFIQEKSYSTNAAPYKFAAISNWSCGGKSVSSHQLTVHSQHAWKTGSSQVVPKNWLSICQLEKSLLIDEHQYPSQRVSVNTDEINELARGRRGSRQATSPPLHLYNIKKYFNKNTELKNNKTAFSVLWSATAHQRIRSYCNTITDNHLSRWPSHVFQHLAIKGKRVLIIFLQRKQSYYLSSLNGVKPNWRGGDISVSSQSAVRSRYAWMFEHYQVSTVLLEITVNQRDKGIIDEKKTDNGSSKGSLLILKRLMSLLRVAKFKTRGITTSPSLYHSPGRLFT